MRTQINKPAEPRIGLLFRLPISPWVFRDPLRFFEDLQIGPQPIASIRIAGAKAYYLREPDLIREMLVTFAPDFHKSRGLERAKAFLGEGLLTSEDELHRHQRKLIQPVFHHDNLQSVASIMRERAHQWAGSWRAGQTLNINEEMRALTQAIVGESLFGTEVSDRAARVSELTETIMETFFLFLSPLASVFEFFGHPKLKRAANARHELGQIVQQMVEDRRNTKQTRSDLLTLLFAAQDPDTGSGMSDDQLRDEVMTLFLAGHETTANALGWTIYLLTQYPAIVERVSSELLGGSDSVRTGSRRSENSSATSPSTARNHGPASEAQEGSLLSRVIRESLRLYPPAWAVGRRATNDVRIGGTTIPKGAIVLACQWAIHRCDRYFSNPSQFDPDRWTPEFQRLLPKYAFFPFGGGPRSCIGEGFAWMELEIVLTELLSRWRFELAPGQTIKPKASITLRPEKPIHVIIR
jgi:cytochrome P450